jgi:hypothetical protein
MLLKMSTSTIRQALETALLTISPSIDTVFENAEYTPVVGTPYQRVFFLFTNPDNEYIGRRFNQRGYMQVILSYPELVGSATAQSRAEAIRSKFKSGQKYSTVSIDRTPKIGDGDSQDGRYVLPVFVNFFQHIQES